MTYNPNWLGHDLKEKGFTYSIRSNRGVMHTYEVTKPSNEIWPDDRSLINFCDGGVGHFGGRVIKGLDVSVVHVYVD